VSGSAEATASRLATNQEGAVKRAQLLSAGVGSSAIKRLTKVGALHRRHRGVYIVGHLALAPYANEAAALLACGDQAVLSHRSALWVWGLLARPSEVDLTLRRGQCRPKRGVRVHRAGLEPGDVRRRHRLPTVSPARAIIDVAATGASDAELERVIAEGRTQGLLRKGELEKALARAGSRPGTRRLRALLRAEGDPGITRSEAERILRRHLRAAGLPQPVTNRRVGKWEPDFMWRSERVIVELDSWPFHKGKIPFETDRERDADMLANGFVTVRVTEERLEQRPRQEAERLQAILESRRTHAPRAA
jgi:very-short-patch-repair endonuclease